MSFFLFMLRNDWTEFQYIPEYLDFIQLLEIGV